MTVLYGDPAHELSDAKWTSVVSKTCGGRSGYALVSVSARLNLESSTRDMELTLLL
jgi:hypothetical protein